MVTAQIGPVTTPEDKRLQDMRPQDKRPADTAAPAADWHALDIADTLDRLATSPAGLSSAEAAGRLRRFGPNALPEQPRRSWFAIVFGQLNSPLIYLLFAASAASLALGELDDAGFILLVLVINTAIGAIQEGRAEANTAALRSAIRTSARVLRDGSVIRLDGREVVPGDIVLLEAGDRVPADLRLLEAAEVQVDEFSADGRVAPGRQGRGREAAAADPGRRPAHHAARRLDAAARPLPLRGRGNRRGHAVRLHRPCTRRARDRAAPHPAA